MIGPCRHCGRQVSSRAPYCSGCGGPIAAAPPPPEAPPEAEELRLDCQVCHGAATMEATRLRRCGGPLRMVGWALVALAFFFVVPACVLFAMNPGVSVVGAALNPSGVLGRLLLALAPGLLGYLLLGHRNVWYCTRCAHTLPRAVKQD